MTIAAQRRQEVVFVRVVILQFVRSFVLVVDGALLVAGALSRAGGSLRVLHGHFCRGGDRDARGGGTSGVVRRTSGRGGGLTAAAAAGTRARVLIAGARVPITGARVPIVAARVVRPVPLRVVHLCVRSSRSGSHAVVPDQGHALRGLRAVQRAVCGVPHPLHPLAQLRVGSPSSPGGRRGRFPPRSVEPAGHSAVQQQQIDDQAAPHRVLLLAEVGAGDQVLLVEDVALLLLLHRLLLLVERNAHRRAVDRDEGVRRGNGGGGGFLAEVQQRVL
mmetsp:Transcript_28844/g.72973  ORF Transcript_28844/g.72973 Transcript_28844/m.72973 type:complete len:275 (+) Transcript_28844:865-1689(+)